MSVYIRRPSLLAQALSLPIMTGFSRIVALAFLMRSRYHVTRIELPFLAGCHWLPRKSALDLLIKVLVGVGLTQASPQPPYSSPMGIATAP
jgi:hypothetical protein